jgi:hypothetical protein
MVNIFEQISTDCLACFEKMQLSIMFIAVALAISQAR